jgi:hypothetical protein
MKRLLVLLVVLGLVLGCLAWADVRVRRYAEDEAQTRLAKAISQARRSEVELVGFPFAGRILARGSIQQLRVTLHGLREADLEIEHIRLVVDDIVLDRSRLLKERVIAVDEVGRVSVDGRVSAETIERAAGVPVRLEDGRASVTVHGQTLDASISIIGRAVMITVVGAPPLVLPLPPEKFLPCEPEVTIAEDRLDIACSATELPSAVMDVLREGVG